MKKTALFLTILLLFLSACAPAPTPTPAPKATATTVVEAVKPPAPAATPEPARSGAVSKNLGRRPASFGSQGQARELLKLMQEQSGKANYAIDYRTDEDTVLFGCDFGKDVIVRIHQRPDGHGTQEAWQGHIIERLRNAASGKSLNDTPKGKKFGTFESF